MTFRFATIALVVLLACSNASSADLNACFENAARKRHISVDLLRAIGHVESRFRPWVTNAQSGAIGVMQIMPVHLKWLRKYGIEREDLYDGCTNINVGAFVLADMIRMFGPTWRAVGAYGAGIAANKEQARKEYATLVQASLEQLKRSGSPALPPVRAQLITTPAAPSRPKMVVD
ncbi:lytic transglycosylase domain-containing protein (plasmid) [Burkholderia multivorans]|uniref:Transglycosylase n=2 Tax=Burkholderia multivorans TaxID=87883 RepID=A0A0H3KWD3_BURM1|nr:lytic transglycosylase domain-containing protein [Burkholderia multivorans]ELK7722784.1 lytic transglycosylase domain-containing protein [Burkholderia cenocepacia]MBR8049420.1 lytic transglycosylase domain-containing protein [Burkholderia multivorans]MBR8453211.1 lytic transglycosylase domain-containing protein [Burkholderia multivorans]MBU9450142.1 lytic transglycosylase domain-containing protein [Burkholderia multivorans]MBU9528796.1 lytic transglycosylase domain-containing protein [Burkh